MVRDEPCLANPAHAPRTSQLDNIQERGNGPSAETCRRSPHTRQQKARSALSVSRRGGAHTPLPAGGFAPWLIIAEGRRTEGATGDGAAWQWRAGAFGCSRLRCPPRGGRIRPALALGPWSGDACAWMSGGSPGTPGTTERRWSAVPTGRPPGRIVRIVARAGKTCGPLSCARARSRIVRRPR